jgi:hypothetical protein
MLVGVQYIQVDESAEWGPDSQSSVVHGANGTAGQILRSRATYNPDVGKPMPLPATLAHSPSLPLAPPSLAVPAAPSPDLILALEVILALAHGLMLEPIQAPSLVAAREVSGSNRSVPGNTLESHGAPRLARSAAVKDHSCATPILAPLALALELAMLLVLALALAAALVELDPEPEPDAIESVSVGT